MSAADPNPMEKSMVSVLVVANAGGGSPLPCGPFHPNCQGKDKQRVLDLLKALSLSQAGQTSIVSHCISLIVFVVGVRTPVQQQ
jgi:hypothetical protein